jgi:cyclic beta-1,2-glucan synthetase
LLISVARVSLSAHHGLIADQLARLPAAELPSAPVLTQRPRPLAPPSPSPPDLEFFNGLGGFDKDGREYVIVLDGDDDARAVDQRDCQCRLRVPGFGDRQRLYLG